MKRIFLLTLNIILLSTLSFGETEVSGGIFNNTTWTKANSPYIVTDDLVIFSDVQLTIEPGVIVKFNDSKSIDLRGELYALGNSQDSIYFISNSSTPTKSSWGGINQDYTSKVELEYIVVSHSNRFLYNNASASCTINNSHFHHCNVAIKNNGLIGDYKVNNTLYDYNYHAVEGYWNMEFTSCIFRNNEIGISNITEPVIDKCLFENNTYGIKDGSYGTVTNSVFKNNSTGLSYSLGGTSDASTISNNTIINNEIGFYIEGGAANNKANNNVICNNSQYNLYDNRTSNNFDFTNNCWCTNDETEIANKIYDAHDDLSLGIIDYSSYKIDCTADSEPLLALNTEEETPKVIVYPNPSNGNIAFEVNESGISSEILIYDDKGNLLMDHSFVDRYTFNGNQLPNGIYFYTLKSNNNSKKGKFTIIK